MDTNNIQNEFLEKQKSYIKRLMFQKKYDLALSVINSYLRSNSRNIDLIIRK